MPSDPLVGGIVLAKITPEDEYYTSRRVRQSLSQATFQVQSIKVSRVRKRVVVATVMTESSRSHRVVRSIYVYKHQLATQVE